MKRTLILYLLLIVYVGIVIAAAYPKTSTNPQPAAQTIKKKPVLILMKVTAYDPWDEKCVGKWAAQNRTNPALRKKWSKPGVASDNGLLPRGTRLWIPGFGYSDVDDTGGDMRKSARKQEPVYHIDLRMASHEEALTWGVQWKLVEVLDKDTPLLAAVREQPN